MDPEWINAKLNDMLRSPEEELRMTADLIIKYSPEGIVRTKLNMLNPEGVNRWNTYDSYTYKFGG